MPNTIEYFRAKWRMEKVLRKFSLNFCVLVQFDARLFSSRAWWCRGEFLNFDMTENFTFSVQYSEKATQHRKAKKIESYRLQEDCSFRKILMSKLSNSGCQTVELSRGSCVGGVEIKLKFCCWLLPSSHGTHNLNFWKLETYCLELLNILLEYLFSSRLSWFLLLLSTIYMHTFTITLKYYPES